VTVKRDLSYLRWRFFNHPFLKYRFISAYDDFKLKGYLIWRTEISPQIKIARIIDVFCEEDTEDFLIKTFLTEAMREQADAADFILSGDYYAKTLLKNGFVNGLEPKYQNFPILFSPISKKKTFINIAYDFGAPITDCFLTKADGDQDRLNPF